MASGFWEKIKKTVFDAPRSAMHFAAPDLKVHQICWRHWLVRGFPDGKYLRDPQVMGKPSN
ncbi:MAG: hypothetical protein ACJAR2_001999 [Ilumatobacter sp.]|jgi:hypothetical protein